jgi:hypothetical protein
MKYHFAFCAVGDTGKRGIFYKFLKFEILHSIIEVSVADPKVTVATRFSATVCPVAPGGHMAHIENHWFRLPDKIGTDV